MNKVISFLLMLLLSIPAIFALSYSQEILGDNPISYWRLGESSGTVAADEQGLNNGAYIGSNRLGISGALVNDSDTAVYMGTTNLDYVAKSSLNDFGGTTLSAEFWMKSADTRYGTPFSYAAGTNDNHFLIYNYNSFDIYIGGVYISTGIKGNDGAWNYFAVTWQSSDGTVKLYKNGNLAFTGTLQTGYTVQTGGTLTIGQEQDSLGGSFSNVQNFVGDLDDVAIYNYALDSDAVSAHYNVGMGLTPTGGVIPEISSMVLLIVGMISIIVYKFK